MRPPLLAVGCYPPVEVEVATVRKRPSWVVGFSSPSTQNSKTLRLPRAQVCEAIVIPNIRLREDLEEAFELNWVEYVRRDTEGSDQDTRRRAATDLVKALTDKFPAKARVGLALLLRSSQTPSTTPALQNPEKHAL